MQIDKDVLKVLNEYQDFNVFKDQISIVIKDLQELLSTKENTVDFIIVVNRLIRALKNTTSELDRFLNSAECSMILKKYTIDITNQILLKLNENNIKSTKIEDTAIKVQINSKEYFILVDTLFDAEKWQYNISIVISTGLSKIAEYIYPINSNVDIINKILLELQSGR